MQGLIFAISHEKFGMMPTAKINTREKSEKKTIIHEIFLKLLHINTTRYNLVNIYYFIILFIQHVVDTCCLLFVSSFHCSVKQWPYVVIWLLFFLWIVSVRCISLFVCWLHCSRQIFQKRLEDNFMSGFDIVNFDHFGISIHQQVISHSSGQFNNDFTCYLQTTLD